MTTPRLLLPLLLGAALVGCGPAPSESIQNQHAAPPLLPAGGAAAIIQCDGPAAETSKLGKLCGFQGETSWQSDVADMSLALGPAEGPYLVVLGFVPDRESTQDQAVGVRYDVRLIETGPLDIGRWSEGTSLSGDMFTQQARLTGCTTDSFIAGGALRHGNVTISFGFRAGSPC